MTTINDALDDDGSYSEADLRESVRLSQTVYESQRVAAVEAHGASTVNAAVPNVNAMQPSSGWRYDAMNDVFIDAVGNKIPASKVTENAASATARRISDDGRVTNYERNRLIKQLQDSKNDILAISGYDPQGKPIYKHADSERERLAGIHDRRVEEIQYALEELDALDEQRARDAAARTAQAEADAEREARIQHEAVLEAERMEIRARAQKIFDAKNKRQVW